MICLFERGDAVADKFSEVENQVLNRRPSKRMGLDAGRYAPNKAMLRSSRYGARIEFGRKNLLPRLPTSKEDGWFGGDSSLKVGKLRRTPLFFYI